MATDRALLQEAREARERLIRLQHETELAQVDYQHAIRRLHAGGASLREIADELGLSFQRVHQIVDVAGGKGAIKDCRFDAVCSFCRASREEVGKLVAGPGVFVCDGCVRLAHEVLSEGAERTEQRVRLVGVAPEDERARCGFCGRRRRRARAMVEAPERPPAGKFARRSGGLRICVDCLQLCDEILSEGLDASPGSR